MRIKCRLFFFISLQINNNHFCIVITLIMLSMFMLMSMLMMIMTISHPFLNCIIHYPLWRMEFKTEQEQSTTKSRCITNWIGWFVSQFYSSKSSSSCISIQCHLMPNITIQLLSINNNNSEKKAANLSGNGRHTIGPANLSELLLLLMVIEMSGPDSK